MQMKFEHEEEISGDHVNQLHSGRGSAAWANSLKTRIFQGR